MLEGALERTRSPAHEAMHVLRAGHDELEASASRLRRPARGTWLRRRGERHPRRASELGCQGAREPRDPVSASDPIRLRLPGTQTTNCSNTIDCLKEEPLHHDHPHRSRSRRRRPPAPLTKERRRRLGRGSSPCALPSAHHAETCAETGPCSQSWPQRRRNRWRWWKRRSSGLPAGRDERSPRRWSAGRDVRVRPAVGLLRLPAPVRRGALPPTKVSSSLPSQRMP